MLININLVQAIIILMVLTSKPASAEIYKCVENGKKVFSSLPCNQEVIRELVRGVKEDEKKKEQERIAREKRLSVSREAEHVRQARAARRQTPCDNDYQVAKRNYERLEAQGRATFEHATIVMSLAAAADRKCGY